MMIASQMGWQFYLKYALHPNGWFATSQNFMFFYSHIIPTKTDPL